MGGMGGGGMNGMGFNGQSPDPEPETDPAVASHEYELHDQESAEIELVPERSSQPNRRLVFTTVARPQLTPDAPARSFGARVQRLPAPGRRRRLRLLGPVVRTATSVAPSPDAAIGSTRTPLLPPVALSGRNTSNPFRAATRSAVLLPSTHRRQSRIRHRRIPIHPRRIHRTATHHLLATRRNLPPMPPPNGYAAPGGYAAPAAVPAPPGAYSGANVIGSSSAPPPAYGQSVLPPPAAVPGTVPPLLNNSPGSAVASPGVGYNGPEDLGLPGSTASVFEEDPPRDIPIRVMANETQTGRLMLGVGVNSNAGLIGNITLDEQNFDMAALAHQLGRHSQCHRLARRRPAVPHSSVAGYGLSAVLVNFHNPYLFNTPISFGLSGSYFTRIYQDWTEKRIGARVSLGYQFLFDPNLSTVVSFKGENVNISNPTIPTPPPLENVLGNNSLFIGQWQVIHDTRDSSFLPTQGHRLNLSLEQAFGSFTFPRATIDVSQHFLLHQRPDTSGRHTLTLSNTTGFAGSNTPIYENFFAGGYTTLRGFYFRGASPLQENVQVGGHFEFINTVEYMFPITGDDMLRGVTFCDFGTVEPNVEMTGQDFRISPGMGLRRSRFLPWGQRRSHSTSPRPFIMPRATSAAIQLLHRRQPLRPTVRRRLGGTPKKERHEPSPLVEWAG